MMYVKLSSGFYRFSVEAFGRRVIDVCNRRGWKNIAEAQAALSEIPFTDKGWLQLKRLIAEVMIGSVGFPDDHAATTNHAGVTQARFKDDEIANRDVTTGVT